MARLKPVAVYIEEAMVGPVTRGDEQDEEKNGAVDTRSVEEIGKKEE